MDPTPRDSIIRLTQALVRLPSRGGRDDYGPVLTAVTSWLAEHGIAGEMLTDEAERPVAVHGIIEGAAPGPIYLLNAPVDTADYGDEARWSHPPTSALISDGWLHGRGTADCKVAVAIFCHLLAALQKEAQHFYGSLAFLFDADEHSGRFTGVRRYFADPARRVPMAGAFIGYPGNSRIVAGCRGFQRAVLRVHGDAAHSGSGHERGVNALERAATLIQRLRRPLPADAGFPLPPQVTVTALAGGGGFSLVPDLCELNVDVRLTPAFDAEAARQFLRDSAGELDLTFPAPRPTEIELLPGWPAYRLPLDSPLLNAIQSAAEQVGGRRPPAVVAGPSNIGNYLATLGIEAVCGFGVNYRNVHAIDEAIELATIDGVYRTYWLTVIALLAESS